MTTKPNPLAVPLVVQTAPKRIWLQIADDAYSATEAFPDEATSEITWCSDSVMDTEVKYVRADLVAELVALSKDLADAVDEETAALVAFKNETLPVKQAESRVVAASAALHAALAAFEVTK